MSQNQKASSAFESPNNQYIQEGSANAQSPQIRAPKGGGITPQKQGRPTCGRASKLNDATRERHMQDVIELENLQNKQESSDEELRQNMINDLTSINSPKAATNTNVEQQVDDLVDQSANASSRWQRPRRAGNVDSRLSGFDSNPRPVAQSSLSRSRSRLKTRRERQPNAWQRQATEGPTQPPNLTDDEQEQPQPKRSSKVKHNGKPEIRIIHSGVGKNQSRISENLELLPQEYSSNSVLSPQMAQSNDNNSQGLKLGKKQSNKSKPSKNSRDVNIRGKLGPKAGIGPSERKLIDGLSQKSGKMQKQPTPKYTTGNAECDVNDNQNTGGNGFFKSSENSHREMINKYEIRKSKKQSKMQSFANSNVAKKVGKPDKVYDPQRNNYVGERYEQVDYNVEDQNQEPFNKQKVPSRQQSLPDGDNDVVQRESSLYTLNPTQEPALVVKSRRSNVSNAAFGTRADPYENDDKEMINKIHSNFAEMQQMKRHNEQFLANQANSAITSEAKMGSAHTIKYGDANYAQSMEAGYNQNAKNGEIKQYIVSPHNFYDQQTISKTAPNSHSKQEVLHFQNDQTNELHVGKQISQSNLPLQKVQSHQVPSNQFDNQYPDVQHTSPQKQEYKQQVGATRGRFRILSRGGNTRVVSQNKGPGVSGLDSAKQQKKRISQNIGDNSQQAVAHSQTQQEYGQSDAQSAYEEPKQATRSSFFGFLDIFNLGSSKNEKEGNTEETAAQQMQNQFESNLEVINNEKLRTNTHQPNPFMVNGDLPISTIHASHDKKEDSKQLGHNFQLTDDQIYAQCEQQFAQIKHRDFQSDLKDYNNQEPHRREGNSILGKKEYMSFAEVNQTNGNTSNEKNLNYCDVDISAENTQQTAEKGGIDPYTGNRILDQAPNKDDLNPYASAKTNTLEFNTKSLESQTPIKKFISNFTNVISEYTATNQESNAPQHNVVQNNYQSVDTSNLFENQSQDGQKKHSTLMLKTRHHRQSDQQPQYQSRNNLDKNQPRQYTKNSVNGGNNEQQAYTGQANYNGADAKKQRGRDGANSIDASFSRSLRRLEDQNNDDVRNPLDQIQQMMQKDDASQKTYMSKTSNQAGKLVMKSKSPMNRPQPLNLNNQKNQAIKDTMKLKHNTKKDHNTNGAKRRSNNNIPVNQNVAKEYYNVVNPDDSNEFREKHNKTEYARSFQNQLPGEDDEPSKGESMINAMSSFFKGFFQPEPIQSNKDYDHGDFHPKFGTRGRISAETKASSSQSAINKVQTSSNFEGYTAQDAIAKFGKHLTEFERIELDLGIYERIYTIGSIRRQNQHSIADKEGHYMAQVGEHLGYRYEITKVIDNGAFGQVVQCVDMKDLSGRIVAAKIGKNKKFDIDNANVEIKFLQKLKGGFKDDLNADLEGKDQIVEYLDSFKFRQHVVIIIEILHFNLYKFIKVNKLKKPIFEAEQLKILTKQIVQGLKYMVNQNVIHCDMKPENIIFTDDTYSSVKIIDFGSSCTDSKLGFFYVQSRYYRAPEIVLGIQYSHPVDMWSLGCIVYELITGRPLFPGHDENELLEYMIVTIGRIPQEMLNNAKKYKTFYKKTNNYLSFYNHEVVRSKESRLPKKLVEGSQPIEQLLQDKASHEIINFIKQCLIIDPEQRMKAHEALHHPWFQMIQQK